MVLGVDSSDRNSVLQDVDVRWLRLLWMVNCHCEEVEATLRSDEYTSTTVVTVTFVHVGQVENDVLVIVHFLRRTGVDERRKHNGCFRKTEDS